mmetsp:Transcript_29980/g.95700  ORF Transcript_29980/g.95700 Transcript_29980/m.95700 type:complete len:245 (+) Transcript_29980:674-1408(+)
MAQIVVGSHMLRRLLLSAKASAAPAQTGWSRTWSLRTPQWHIGASRTRRSRRTTTVPRSAWVSQSAPLPPVLHQQMGAAMDNHPTLDCLPDFRTHTWRAQTACTCMAGSLCRLSCPPTSPRRAQCFLRRCPHRRALCCPRVQTPWPMCRPSRLALALNSDCRWTLQVLACLHKHRRPTCRARCTATWLETCMALCRATSRANCAPCKQQTRKMPITCPMDTIKLTRQRRPWDQPAGGCQAAPCQ